MGIVALGRWAWLKLLRQASRPHYVARGAALGVVVSFFPVLGTHTLIIAVLGYVFSANLIAAMLTSMLANPWTLPFIWAGSHKLGAWLMGTRIGMVEPVHFDVFQPTVLIRQIPEMLETVLLSTMVGGVVLSIPLAALVYGAVYWRLRQRRATPRS